MDEKLLKEANGEEKHVVKYYGIEPRVEKYSQKQCFITFKDHKESFIARPTCRLINPGNTRIGKVSKTILDRVNASIREKCQLAQWRSSKDVIDWFNEKSKPEKHIGRVHERMNQNKCQQCNFVTSKKVKVDSHVNTVHNKESVSVCEKCDYATDQNGTLESHINAVHQKGKYSECIACNYTTPDSGTLNCHLKCVHKYSKNLHCNICAYETPRTYGLNSHTKGEVK